MEEFRSKLQIPLGNAPVGLDASDDVFNLFESVRVIFRELSNIAGKTIYTSASYSSLPITTTINNQNIDKLYVTTNEALAVGDFVNITSAGATKALFTGSNPPHAVVLEVPEAGYAICTTRGAVPNYTNLTVGQRYYLSTTVAGGYTTNSTNCCQQVGFGISPTEMYITL